MITIRVWWSGTGKAVKGSQTVIKLQYCRSGIRLVNDWPPCIWPKCVTSACLQSRTETVWGALKLKSERQRMHFFICKNCITWEKQSYCYVKIHWRWVLLSFKNLSTCRNLFIILTPAASSAKAVLCWSLWAACLWQLAELKGWKTYDKLYERSWVLKWPRAYLPFTRWIPPLLVRIAPRTQPQSCWTGRVEVNYDTKVQQFSMTLKH